MRTRVFAVIVGVMSVLLIVQASGFSEELIEPSRTLEGQETPTGQLSVFSEPPGLEVFLDGVRLGQTPVNEKSVSSGVHLLGVKEAEKEISIPKGRGVRYSFFKGELILIPAKKASPPAQPTEEKKMGPEKKKKEETPKPQVYDPFYWPMNPKGPIS